MARNAMIRRTHAQTPHGACKEASKNNHITPLRHLFPPFKQVEKYADEEKREAAQEMRMDIHALVVDVEE